MNRFDIMRLASSLSGKERAKLLITSWHEAIIGKQTFSKAETDMLVQFKEPGEGRICRYYLTLYRYGYFMVKNMLEETYLKIVILSSQLQQFHKALVIDGVITAALRAIENVPTFLTETEF